MNLDIVILSKFSVSSKGKHKTLLILLCSMTSQKAIPSHQKIKIGYNLPCCREPNQPEKHCDFTKWYLTFLFPLAKNFAPFESSFQLFICILLLAFTAHNTST
jgi:hypothetical protein